MAANFSSVTIRFVALLSVIAICVATLVIPASFSAVHKTTYLQENTSIESVLKVLSSFEIDSHIEIVLVGNGFTAAIKDELQRSLKALSDVAATTSPLKFVHEQFVYHVSSDAGLNAKLLLHLQPSTGLVDLPLVGHLLTEYHDNAANPTTIFVMHSGSASIYAYDSRLPSCPQRTFLARKGFALLDLSARAEKIRSTSSGNDHIVSDMDFTFLGPTGAQQGSSAIHTSVHDLATLIHRSGEALVPFPIFSSDMALFGDSSASSIRKALAIQDPHHTKEVHYVDEEPPIQDETLIEVIVFNICMGHGNCVDDEETSHALQNLLSGLSSNSHNVMTVAAHLSADSSPEIAHAIHAATSYSPDGSPGSLKLSSKELLFWLGSSTVIRKILSQRGRYFQKQTEFKKRVLPVFVVQLPPDVECLLEQRKQVIAQPFPEPAGGWLTDDEDSAAMFSLHRQGVFESDWPSTAVVAVLAPKDKVLYVPPSLECSGYWVKRTINDYVSDLVEVLQTAIWGILPSHTHYSSSSKTLVKDYLWACPPAMRQFLDGKKEDDHLADFSFRERRQIQRHGVIHACDKMIGKFSDILLDASSIRPAINITSILGLKDHHPNGYNARVTSMNNPFSKNKNVAKDILKKDGKPQEKSLFENFLFHLDLSAASFSHLDYSKALNHLKDAQKVQNELKDLVDSLIRMRTGSYVCKDMRIETKVRQLENMRNGIQETDFAFIKGQNQRIHESRRNWTWIFGILGSIIIGCIIGYDVASSKSKRVLL